MIKYDYKVLDVNKKLQEETETMFKIYAFEMWAILSYQIYVLLIWIGVGHEKHLIFPQAFLVTQHQTFQRSVKKVHIIGIE